MSRKDTERGFVSRNMSTESTSSAGGGEIPSRMAGSGLKGSKDPTTNLFDCCVLLLHCPRHNRFALKKINKAKGLWLPFIAISASDSWIQSIKALTKQCATFPGRPKAMPHNLPELLHFTRIQLPFTTKFLIRMTYYTDLTDANSPCCDALDKELVWLTSQELQNINRSDFWGPEPGFYVNAFLSQDGIPDKIPERIFSEYTLRDIKKMIPKHTASKSPSPQEEMVRAAKFSEKDCLSLYSDFVQQCYPSMFMTLPSFSELMKKKGWTGHESDLSRIFRACRTSGEEYMVFSELLLGLAAMDSNTPQAGSVGEVRTAYIFRFYDLNCDDNLNYLEMSRLTLDILRVKNKPHDEAAIAKELLNIYTILKVKPNEPVDLETLRQGFARMDFRGISDLFRSPLTSSALIRPVFPSTTDLQSLADAKTGASKSRCSRCSDKIYHMATHSVRLNSSGIIEKPVDTEQDDGRNSLSRARSLEYFDENNISNKVLDIIRDNADAESILKHELSSRPKRKLISFWGTPRVEKIIKLLEQLCVQVTSLLMRESRVVKVDSPCYVLGDIHGNLHDLLIFERLLWRRPACEPANYLFLGDYVDRGPNGIECIMYLFAMKVLSPEKVTLLRGNHELREIQKTFSFMKETIARFGPIEGLRIWEMLNKVFDYMPIAAVIDDSIYCAHGGIPASASKIEELLRIPMPLNDPETMSPAAWEILWSDPISASEFVECEALIRQQSKGGTNTTSTPGFVSNSKRGTAYFFADQAVNSFLEANSLSHIIRGHEMIPAGYHFHSKGRVITVFSTSKYCGGNNEAACALVDREKIRILRLVTSIQ